MSLRVLTRIPYGNAADVAVRTGGEMPEVHFAADPHGGPECLWFCFRLEETEPDNTPADAKVRLVLKHFDNVRGAGDPAQCMPVYRPADQGWFRMKHGQPHVEPDGRRSVSWVINHPTPSTEIAFCFPYGRPEIKRLLQKSKGYWHADPIGLSRDCRPLVRLSNESRTGGPGLFLVARQHAGETPGSWVLDGVLQQLSRSRKNAYVTWSVPLADIDGVLCGDYGKDAFPCDMNCAWGTPPRRHENLAYQRDISRWIERCKPVLGLDFHAPGACETSGVYCYLPSPDRSPALHKEATKWANVINEALTDEYAAADFKRVLDVPARYETPSFMRYFCEQLGICALTVETPYAVAGKTAVTQKVCREIGKRIADALIRGRI